MGKQIRCPRDARFCRLFYPPPPAYAVEKTWRGLHVAPEYRCEAYKRNDYRYPQSVESDLVSEISRIYGPYTGRTFASTYETDIDHIIALSEAHDSGLCAADVATRSGFARDLLNLTLAAPETNRCGRGGKCAFDAAEWTPPRNACWFAGRVVEVRRKYSLTIDRAEADALDRILSSCDSTDMILYENAAAVAR